jgi:hypothetical protein
MGNTTDCSTLLFSKSRDMKSGMHKIQLHWYTVKAERDRGSGYMPTMPHTTTPHIPSPAKSAPSATIMLVYAAVWRPIAARIGGPWMTESAACTAVVSGNVMYSTVFVTGTRCADTAERRYAAERSSTTPSAKTMDATRCRAVMNTGICWGTPSASHSR